MITTIPNTVLVSPAKPVIMFDKKLEKMIAVMKKTLKATVNPKGVGLAAPQISEPWRVFITRPTEKTTMRVFINPTITHISDPVENADKNNQLEGCLSIPNIWGSVKRSSEVTLEYQDETGVAHTETFTGFMAVIVQHETDHLNGVLFTKRVVEQNNTLYQTVIDEKGKEILEEISI